MKVFNTCCFHHDRCWFLEIWEHLHQSFHQWDMSSNQKVFSLRILSEPELRKIVAFAYSFMVIHIEYWVKLLSTVFVGFFLKMVTTIYKTKNFMQIRNNFLLLKFNVILTRKKSENFELIFFLSPLVFFLWESGCLSQKFFKEPVSSSRLHSTLKACNLFRSLFCLCDL